MFLFLSFKISYSFAFWKELVSTGDTKQWLEWWSTYHFPWKWTKALGDIGDMADSGGWQEMRAMSLERLNKGTIKDYRGHIKGTQEPMQRALSLLLSKLGRFEPQRKPAM